MYKTIMKSMPYATTALINEPVLTIEGSNLLLLMVFDDDGKKKSITIQFKKQRAFRARGEIYCTGWHVKDSYDAICEIKDSEWVNELLNDAVPDKRSNWVMRHFIIYIDSFGCLEVVAESVEIIQGE